MKIHHLLVSLCLLPLMGHAADVAPKPSNNMGVAPPARAAMQAPGVPEIGADQAMVALFSLAPLMNEFEVTVQPLGSHYQPFSQWAGQTRQELRALIDTAKVAKTSGDMVLLSNKAKPQFEKAIKIAKAIVPLDPEVHFLKSQIAKASECLGKRHAALQQAEEKIKTAIQFAMGGMPASVSSLKSLVTEANTACP
ncbi:MAG: hypothetical protein V4858_28240 [Pseudomonadota bacterium]